MARFPKAEADVSALAMSMMVGYSGHALDFFRISIKGVSFNTVL